MLMKLAIKVKNQFQSLKDLEIETRVRKGWKIIKQNQKHEPSTRSNLNHKYLKRAQKNHSTISSSTSRETKTQCAHHH